MSLMGKDVSARGAKNSEKKIRISLVKYHTKSVEPLQAMKSGQHLLLGARQKLTKCMHVRSLRNSSSSDMRCEQKFER